jgi:hypothetical protein
MVNLRERIAAKLGWTVEETQSLSLQALRELVRSDAKLFALVTAEIQNCITRRS